LTLPPPLTNGSEQDIARFHTVIRHSLTIRRHEALLHWLHNEVQYFVPHQLLVAAWGHFALGEVHLDIVSHIPGLRTSEVDRQDLLPLLVHLFERWTGSDRKPFSISQDSNEFRSLHLGAHSNFARATGHLKSALCHGIKDERGRHDCLYLLMNDAPRYEADTVEAVALLLPYIDAALRQVPHLPQQYLDDAELHSCIADAAESRRQNLDSDYAGGGFSRQEEEIMGWIRRGKTPHEISALLDVSQFTLKMQLQRIYRKVGAAGNKKPTSGFERTGTAEPEL
jgi:transcriptional regulator EpsA